MSNTERNPFADKSMAELVELEKYTANSGITSDDIAADTQKQQNANPLIKTDAVPKIVVSDNKLEANMCVFAPQNGGKDVTMDSIRQVLKDEHIKFGIDNELIEEIISNKLYDKVFTVARGVPAADGEDGYVTNKYEQVKKLVPRKLEDGSVDYRDLGLVVNVEANAVICEITNETQGTEGTNVFGQTIPPRPGKPPKIPQGINTVLSGDGTKLYSAESGNLVFKGGNFNIETTFVIHDDVCAATGNISFLGDVVVKGSVQEGFSVTAGKSLTIMGMATGATLTAQGDITVKNGVFNSTVVSAGGNVNLGFGENDNITTRGNLVSTSLIGCNIKIEGSLECTKNPGVLIGGECSVMGNFTVAQLGHKNYIHTVVSVGSMTNLVMEMDSLEKQCTEIDEYIEKLNASIEFLQEKKRNGEKLDESKESYISSAIRLKVQRAMEKKPLRARIEEIQRIISKKEDLSLKITKCIYPNVKINLNSFTTVTSSEYGRCNVVCGPNDIEFK